MGLPSNINYGADDVMNNMIALKRKGYNVEINFSLGNYNKHEFMNVLSFGICNQIPVKCIVLVKHDETNKKFYDGKQSFIDPKFIKGYLDKFECKLIKTDKTKIGGYTEYYQTSEKYHGVSVIIKNISHGRLRTSMCDGCAVESQCGEGVYALRSGVDETFKP